MTKQTSYTAMDGFQRKQEDDVKISHEMASLFSTPSGQQILQYLRSITIDAVSGANISDNELRHLEGQRYLVGLIVRRINHSHGVKNK
jgi:hypothetical protein